MVNSALLATSRLGSVGDATSARRRRRRMGGGFLLVALLATGSHLAAAADAASASEAALNSEAERTRAGEGVRPWRQAGDSGRVVKGRAASKKKRKSASEKVPRAMDVLGLAAPLVLETRLATAEAARVPMLVLDPEFDKKKSGEIAKLRQQIGALDPIVKANAASKKKDDIAAAKAGRAKLEQLKNALADLALEYASQIEMAEALARIDQAQALADQFKKGFFDMLWRLERRASSGNARAQATVGTMYRLGIVAELSNEKACESYGRAAQAGYVTALYHFASCGDPKSEAAVRMLELAAEGDHPVAQEMIGRRCLRERPNPDCAVGWLGRAAAQGRASAMSLLGWMYSTGELVQRDDALAFKYLLDAAKLGDAAAQNNVGQIYETGRGVAASGVEAFAWYKRAAEAGLGSAQVNLARAYIEGRGTAPDKAAAKSWLDQAQKQGVAEAGRLLAWLEKQ